MANYDDIANQDNQMRDPAEITTEMQQWCAFLARQDMRCSDPYYFPLKGQQSAEAVAVNPAAIAQQMETWCAFLSGKWEHRAA